MDLINGERIKPQNVSEMEEDLNHNRLPNEILSHIFTLAAQDHGPVYFPISKKNRSPQLVISHVCSHWRRVALCTPELWSNTELAYTEKNGLERVIDLHKQWLLRAGKFPVTLSIEFEPSLDGDKVASALQKISLPFQIKSLCLNLFYDQFEKLSNLPETTLSDLAALDLRITLPDCEAVVNITLPHFITRLQSLTLDSEGLVADDWFHKLRTSLPWGQLRLRQIPMLQILDLYLDIDVFENLTMPCLLDFLLAIDMEDNEGRELDKVLCCFTCPSLENFTLYANHTPWTFKTIEILKQQYNMHNLQEAEFNDGCGLPVSSILQNAPMLRRLSLPPGVVLDATAIDGISYGILGRHLRSFEMGRVVHNLEVERRKETADEFIKNGCSWREEITVLKEVAIRISPGEQRKYRDRVGEMRKAGITIT
ncbi:hypothetical protein F5887DRAFT_540832 [Amanita rubescens]|nr:hypothetical protein F5887DRAFT_540832 [Amanita rubescens]